MLPQYFIPYFEEQFVNIQFDRPRGNASLHDASGEVISPVQCDQNALVDLSVYGLQAVVVELAIFWASWAVVTMHVTY